MGSGDIFAIAIDRLLPSQVRYSSQNVDEKIRNALKKSYAIRQDGGKYALAFDNGQSLYPPHQPLPAIDFQNGYYLLIDGHHSILASQRVGATRVFVKIIEKAQDYPHPSFWQSLEKRGLAYLKLLGGTPCPPAASFDILYDDPVRYFVSLARCKVDEKLDISKARGAHFPLWLKIGKDTPFIEFKIADYLYAHGFRMDTEELKNPQNNLDSLIEEARAVFNTHPTSEFRILYNRSATGSSQEIQTYLEKERSLVK